VQKLPSEMFWTVHLLLIAVSTSSGSSVVGGFLSATTSNKIYCWLNFYQFHLNKSTLFNNVLFDSILRQQGYKMTLTYFLVATLDTF